MNYAKVELLDVLKDIDFGSSIAELDGLLETARVETSAFSDLASDKVDLVPGTKGSGKSALFRIFVEFLPQAFLRQHRVVIAHGVKKAGDSVFHAFRAEFEQLNEDDFQDFWCIYVVSLVNEQFLKDPLYEAYLRDCAPEIELFKLSCQQARIPEVKAARSLMEVLQSVLYALSRMKPKLTFRPPGDAGEFGLTLFGVPEEKKAVKTDDGVAVLPVYMDQIRTSLEQLLKKAGLSIWIMIDKLDEIFPRRSLLERTALRGLLRTLRIFTSDTIRLKLFLRDDMLGAIVSGGEGFAALTHIVARQADTLRWSEDQILTMVVNRLFWSEKLCKYVAIDPRRLEASLQYRTDAFYRVFPPTVHKGSRQSPTMSWLYNHTADANGVVTPRDVIDLLTRAKQHQQGLLTADSEGFQDTIISAQAILYGHNELSNHKRTTYLEAEFPHLWPYMKRFIDGKSDYSPQAIRSLLGREWQDVVVDLRSIGFISVKGRKEAEVYSIPHVYRRGLQITQGTET